MSRRTLPSYLMCGGCGWVPAEADAYPFRCANADSGDDVNHLLVRVLNPDSVGWPSGDESNPFVRFRELFHSYHLARANGMRDGVYVELVERLDKAIAEVDGHGFTVTPFFRSGLLSERLGFGVEGGVWVKDETGNVSGSHKARHLMGIAIHLAVVERLGLAPEGEGRPLAIASCGNAALAAAVVARAMKRTLDVFVPTWADPVVIGRLNDLGARITVCPREGGVPGDPTYYRLQRAIRSGSIPFTCQGPDNGLTIEGGETLAYEIASQPVRATMDRVFVQVGGGALASSVIQGFEEASWLGVIRRVPRVHAVQAEGGHPLDRAYRLVAHRIAERLEADAAVRPKDVERAGSTADSIATLAREPAVREELLHASQHRSEFMWPWDEEPKSVAHGILDDETYDWLAVVKGMVATGGRPVVVSESELVEANELGRRATGVDVDHTGSAGLAGLMHLRAEGEVGSDERVVVLFTGVRRDKEGEP